MVKLGSTLESSRKDGRLANSDNIYDKISGKMQEDINREVSALSPVDEEDLTRSFNDNGRSVTKFADRSYSPQNFSGKGYKILRKNIKPVSLAITEIVVSSVPTSDGYLSFIINGVESHVDVVASNDTTTDKVAEKIATKLKDTMSEYDVSRSASTITLTRKFGGTVSTASSFSAVGTGASCSVEDCSKIELRNILTAVMINQPNTIYEVRYDFDLDNENVSIPKDCVLKFNHGTIKNGTISGDDTIITAYNCEILKDITLKGTFKNTISHSIWFSKDNNGYSDCQLNNSVYILSSGGILFVDKDIYNIYFRWDIQNKKNIAIINEGIIKPIDGKIPNIGTVNITSVSNSKFINFNIDGNNENIPETTGIGTQVLLHIENVTNITVENLTIYNSRESGVGGSNLNNVLFNNVWLQNLGEHGFYIGGTVPSTNVSFTNIYAKNIGKGKANNNRECAVIKFRAFKKGIKHKNISIDTFFYEEEATSTNIGKYNIFCILLDVNTFKIANGTIQGLYKDNRVCILHTNAISCGTVNNVIANCIEFLNYSYIYGDNDSTAIEEDNILQNNISFYNCTLIGNSNFCTIANFNKCNINVLVFFEDSYINKKVNKFKLQDCIINLNTAALKLAKCDNLVLDNCLVNSSSTNIITCLKDINISFNKVTVNNSKGTSYLLNKASSDIYVSLVITESSIVSKIDNASTVILNNLEYKMPSYGKNIIATNGVYKDNKNIDTFYTLATAYSDTLTVDTRFKIAKKIDENNVIIHPVSQEALDYSYTINDNIITISIQNYNTPIKFRVWVI